MEGWPINTTRSPDGERLTTSYLAVVSGYSVQQIRDLEHLGVIPQATRRTNGYRQFGTIHVTGLRAYRNLAIAVGPAIARATMSELPTLNFDEAVAKIVALHVTLARSRADTQAALHALNSIVDEGTSDAAPDPRDTMTITELSIALGVRSSTLRFWEQEGLIAPERGQHQATRRYPPNATTDARIVAALRAGGYRIPAIREVMTSLRVLDKASRANGADAQNALHERLHTIATQSEALLRAGTDLTDLLQATAAPPAR